MKKTECPQCQIYAESINQLVKGGIDPLPRKVNLNQTSTPPRSLKQLVNAAFDQLDNGDTDGTRDYLFNALLLVNDQPDAKNTYLSNLLHDAIDEAANNPEFDAVQEHLFAALGAFEGATGEICSRAECDPKCNYCEERLEKKFLKRSLDEVKLSNIKSYVSLIYSTLDTAAGADGWPEGYKIMARQGWGDIDLMLYHIEDTLTALLPPE